MDKAEIAKWASIGYAGFVATWCLAHHLGVVPAPLEAAHTAKAAVAQAVHVLASVWP